MYVVTSTPAIMHARSKSSSKTMPNQDMHQPATKSETTTLMPSDLPRYVHPGSAAHHILPNNVQHVYTSYTILGCKKMGKHKQHMLQSYLQTYAGVIKALFQQ